MAPQSQPPAKREAEALSGRQSVTMVSGLPRAAGWIDYATSSAGGLVLGGWAVVPTRGPFDSLRAYWNGMEIARPQMWDRPDLADALYWLPRGADAGFKLSLEPQLGAGRLDVVGECTGQPVARLSVEFITPDREAFPLPPDHLAERVSAVSGEIFRLSGLQCHTDIHDQLRRYLGAQQRVRLLDWGCGCGRVTRYLAANRMAVATLLGCDIDGEAVDWCREHLPGHFSKISPDPPLPYSPGEVDVIIACSVFTHLGREHQLRWLDELHRVLTPGGLLIASVTSEYAFVLHEHRKRSQASAGSISNRAHAFRAAAWLRVAGFIDRSADPALAGIAPSGFYRAVFQTRKYTSRKWRKSFEIVDYIARGLNGHQDLVVMRRRDGEPRVRAAHHLRRR